MKYQSVNGAWPEGTRDGRDLKPTPQEAMTAARRLYRLAMKRPFRGKVKLTSGNRNTWIRGGVMSVNPDLNGHRFHKERDQEGAEWRTVYHGGGWHEIVHALSHYCARRLYPKAGPHDGRHAFLERTMIEHVVNSGWLDDKLKRPEKQKVEPNVKQVRRERVNTRIKTWEAKRKRAERALAKLRRQARYYDRQIAA